MVRSPGSAVAELIVCGSHCEHPHDGINGPTGCCPKGHGPYLYFCYTCHEEWQVKNPATTAAIEDLASGKGSIAAIKKAREVDRG